MRGSIHPVSAQTAQAAQAESPAFADAALPVAAEGAGRANRGLRGRCGSGIRLRGLARVTVAAGLALALSLSLSLAISGCGPEATTGGEGLGDGSNTPQGFVPSGSNGNGGSIEGGAAVSDRELFADDRNLDRTLNDPDAAAMLGSPASGSSGGSAPRADGWTGDRGSGTDGNNTNRSRDDSADTGSRGRRSDDRRATGGGSGANPPSAAASGTGSANQGSGGGWAIPLATFSLENHRQTAMAFRAQFQSETGLTRSWIDTSRSDRSIVWYGQYDAHNDPQLVADLATLREVTVGGDQAFRKVLPSLYWTESSAGSIPQYSIHRIREMFPGRDRIFTLQIGFFEPDRQMNRALAEQAAEEWVMQLRSEGHPAFYYHGPTRSSVTVGVFFEDAIDPELAVDPEFGYSAEVVAMRQKFPYNLDNGRLLIERRNVPQGARRDGRRGGRGNQDRVIETPQPSMLVPVP